MEKMEKFDVTFSVNLHDTDGDAYSKGLFLFFGERVILKLQDVEELQKVIKQLKKIKKEVTENYG